MAGCSSSSSVIVYLPDKNVNFSCFSFAHDSKLQSLLIELYSQLVTDHSTEWADKNGMDYTVVKFKSIIFAGSVIRTPAPKKFVYLHCRLNRRPCMIVPRFSWDNHFKNILVAARKACQFLKRTALYSVSSSTMFLTIVSVFKYSTVQISRLVPLFHLREEVRTLQ